MSNPADILISLYPVLQNLVGQAYCSINDINIYDTALRTQDGLANYTVVNLINYTQTAVASPNFVNQVIYANPNILLFLSQNPNIISYFINPANLAQYTTFLNSSFPNTSYGFTDSPSNPKTDLFCYITAHFPLIAPNLADVLSQNCPENGIVQIHSSIFGITPDILKLLSSYPLLNYLVNQNYMYEIYYDFLFNNANLVLLLINYPSLLNAIILGSDGSVNPNILCLLGYYSNLTYDFNFYPSDITTFLSTPNILNINLNLYDILLTTNLKPYLDNTIVYPIINTPTNAELNRIALLYNYPSLNLLIHQNYNNEIYRNIFYTDAITNFITFALAQYNLNLVNNVYPNFPNIVTDVLDLNPNLLGLLYENPNLTAYLSENTKTLYDFLIYKGSETYSIRNPMTDLYNNFASSFLAIRNLTYLLNATPNPPATNGVANNVGNGPSGAITLYNSNLNFRYLFNQNYLFNMYYNNLYYNRRLTDMLNNQYYDETTNTTTTSFYTPANYLALLTLIYRNPNVINFLTTNPRLLTEFLYGSNTNLANFLAIPNIQIPYYDLNDILYQYDIQNGTSYSTYLEKAYATFLESSTTNGTTIGNIDQLKSLVGQNYPIYSGTADPNYIPTNYNNGQNVYKNLFSNNDQFINFITYFLDQANLYNIIDLVTVNPNFLTFLANNYNLLFYLKSQPIDLLRLLSFQSQAALSPLTDLTQLVIDYSAQTYPLDPTKVSQYLNTTLPISGPFSGIGNNPQILALLTANPDLNTLVTQNYNYNLFYYDLYNANNLNIVTFIQKFASVALPLIYQNPLFIDFLYQNQTLVNYLNLPTTPSSQSDLLFSLSLIGTPYIDIFKLVNDNALFPYLSTFKSLIANYGNLASILYQPYVSTGFDVDVDLEENIANERIESTNYYYYCLQDEGLVAFIYYAISQYDYHNKVNPTATYYPYIHILDIINTNPNLINFFYQYTTLRTYLSQPANTLVLAQILQLSELRLPYVNLYNTINSFAISTGNAALKIALDANINPYNGIYTSAAGTASTGTRKLEPVYLSENVEIILTYPQMRELISGDYNHNLYYNAIYGSPALQALLLKYLPIYASVTPTTLATTLITRILSNPNILLYLYHHTTLTQAFLSDTSLSLLQTFATTPNLDSPITNIGYALEDTILAPYLREYRTEFLNSFQQFLTLYNQTDLLNPRYRNCDLVQATIQLIYYTLQLNFDDNSFPYLIPILESNPNLINFLNANPNLVSFLSATSNVATFKQILNYSFVDGAPPYTYTIRDPITNLTTFFSSFQTAFPSLATYTLAAPSSYSVLNANISNVTAVDQPNLVISSSSLNTLLLDYPGLATIVKQQHYNNGIYYYALQNQYLVDLIVASIEQYNSLAWSVHIVTGAIYYNPNLLSFLYQNPRLVYYYTQNIAQLEPLLNYIAAAVPSGTAATLNLYAFVAANPTWADYLTPAPPTPDVADLSNIGVTVTATPLVNGINTLSGIIYQNYNQNIYYKNLYNNPTLNALINGSAGLQSLCTLNPNIVNFLAYYPDLTQTLATFPPNLAIFLSVSTLEYPNTSPEAEIAAFAPSLLTYITNNSILYKLLNGTPLGSLTSQQYNFNVHFEALYRNIPLAYLLYGATTGPSLLPLVYQNPTLLIHFANRPIQGNLLDYLQYNPAQVDYFTPLLNAPLGPNITSPLLNLENISFKYYLMKGATIAGGLYPNIFSTLLDQDYNVNNANISIYQKSIYNELTCDYFQFIFDKFFYLDGVPAATIGSTYAFPNIFNLLSSNPNLINLIYNNPDIAAYHRSQPINDYIAITNFWGAINAGAPRLSQNAISLFSNPEFYIYSTFYLAKNRIQYALGNSVSNLVSQYPIFTNLLQQYYNDGFYQQLVYNSTAFQNFIAAYPLSIVFNAFSFNANIISFLAYNSDLTTYFISNSADIYYFLNNLSTQNPANNLNNIILYNDLNRPLGQSNATILYTYLTNAFKLTLENPTYAVLNNLYQQLYNQNIYWTDLQVNALLSFVYLNSRLYQNYIGTYPLFPNFLNLIASNPNLLNFLAINPTFLNTLSTDTALNTSFNTSYIYRFFLFTYTDITLVPPYTFAITDPLTNLYTFTQKFSSTLYAQLVPLTGNIYSIGTTVPLTDLINANPKLSILLNQLYNRVLTSSATYTYLYYNALYQNKYLVELLAGSSALLNNIYLNPNILLFLSINPNLIIALLQNPALLTTFNTLLFITDPNTNLYDQLQPNLDFQQYLITQNELFIQNFKILTDLKNQFYLHEFYIHKLLPIDNISVQNQTYHYRIYTNPLNQFMNDYYQTIYIPNLFEIIALNPNLINYLFYHPSLLQYFIHHPNYLQSYAYLPQLSIPTTDLSTFTLEYLTEIEQSTGIRMIAYDDAFYTLLLKSRDTASFENDLIVLLNQNPTLNSLVQQEYNYNYSLSDALTFYLYHLTAPNIIQLLSISSLDPGYTLLETIYQNPNLLVFLTNNPDLVNYLNNFNNEITTVTSLTGINLPATNLYDLFMSNANFSLYINTIQQILFDGYKVFEELFSQGYNKNIYYIAYKSSPNDSLITLIYNSLLYTFPTLIDIFETNANLLLFLAQNPLLIDYLNANIVDLQRLLSYDILVYPITNIYDLIVNQLSYLKPYLSQIPTGTNSGIGTTPAIETLLAQYAPLNNLIQQNYNQNVYYIDLYDNSALVTLLSTSQPLRTAVGYNNNILQFLSFNPLILNDFATNPANLTIFLTNNGILDPLTNLYDFIVTYLPTLEPFLNESLTGIYSTIGTTDALTALLAANPKLSQLINQNYNANIYYLDLYNHPDLVTLLSTPSTITTVSTAQTLLGKVYKNPNILNYLNNNPALVTYFLNASTDAPFILFTGLTGLDSPLVNIDDLVKTSLPSLTRYLSQVSIGLNSTVGTTTALTSLIAADPVIAQYANIQNYIENLYYIGLYKVADLVTLITDNQSLFDQYVTQNPNILNFLASMPKLCAVLLQSAEKLNFFFQLPDINVMTTNIYDLIVKSSLYGDVNTTAEMLRYNYYEKSIPQFYNDFLFESSFAVTAVSDFMYYGLAIALPNSAELFRLNPNFINFLRYNYLLTQQLNLEYLRGYEYNFTNILSIPEMTDPTADITALVTAYINSSLNVTLSTGLLNASLPKAGPSSGLGTTTDLTALLAANPKLLSLVSQNYNDNIYYKALYYNDYLVNLLLSDSESGGTQTLLPLIYSNPLILNFLADSPKLVTYLNQNIQQITVMTGNQDLYSSNVNIQDTLLPTTLGKYLNLPVLSLTAKYPLVDAIVSQTYNGVNDVGSSLANKNDYYNALQNPYVSYLIYLGAYLSETTTTLNILDLIKTNMNIILFLSHNLELTKYLIANPSTAYLQFVNLPNLGVVTTNITAVLTQSAPTLAIYLNTSLTNGGLTSGYGTTPALTTLLTNNTILNNIVSTNYIDNIYYINLYNNTDLVTLINQSTSLLQYIYTNPNIINFLATNPLLITYMLSNSAFVTAFNAIPDVGINSTNLVYQEVLYQILLRTYPLLAECVNQIYNLLPSKPFIYKLTLNQINILEFIYYAIQNVPTKNIVTEVIYGNPNFINFLYDNPNLVAYFTQNLAVFQNYMTLSGLNSPIVDLYQLTLYFGTRTGNTGISAQLNQKPLIVGINSGIGTSAPLTTLIETNDSLKSLINQNYNFNIYYTYLITYPKVVTLLTENFSLLYAVYQNPNIITFLGNNPKLVDYFLSNEYAIELFLSIPNVTNPMYDLYALISAYDTTTTNDAAVFQSLLNRSMYVLLGSYPGLENIVLQFTQGIDITNPVFSTLNYQMNNTYFYTMSTNQSLVDFIYINLSNPGLPNIINKILKNPNIINYLGTSDLTVFNTYIDTYYKNVISNPLIEDPANDINEINIPLFNPNPTYFERAFYNKSLFTVASENAYYHNMCVNYINVRKIIQQKYCRKMYEYNLTYSSQSISANQQVLYLANVGTFPYLSYLATLIPSNPNVINFLVNNPQLVQAFITTPSNFTLFSSLLNNDLTYSDMEADVNTNRPTLAPYLSINTVYPLLNPGIQSLIDQKYNNAIYRNVLYSNLTVGGLVLANGSFASAILVNPNLLPFLHRNPALAEFFKLNDAALTSFLADPNVTNPLTDLWTYVVTLPAYSPYINLYQPLAITYTNAGIAAVTGTYPGMAALLGQRYIGNSETNLYYDAIYYNANLAALLVAYPAIEAAAEVNPNLINFLAKNCANPLSSGVTSLVDYLIANPGDVATFLGVAGTDPSADLYTLFNGSPLFAPLLTNNNIPLLYSSPLFANLLALVNQDYNNDIYFNAFNENNGIYDFINYVYNIFITSPSPTPFRNIFILLNNNPNILLYLRENPGVALYLTNPAPANYADCLTFMNIPAIDKLFTNIEDAIQINNYLNPSPLPIPAYTTADLTLLLNNNPNLKKIVYQNYNYNHYYDTLYKNPGVVSLLLINTFEYATLIPLVVSNPTIINFFAMYPDLVVALSTNVNNYLIFSNIIGINIASNNLVQLVKSTSLNLFMNTEYDLVLLNSTVMQNLMAQPYNEFLYYKSMNQRIRISYVIRKYENLGVSPSLVNDVIQLNPNMINFLAKNPLLTEELYNNSALYIGTFIPLFGTFASPLPTNYPYTDLYALIAGVPALAPFLSPPEPTPPYGNITLTNFLDANPTLRSIVLQNYNEYIYYKNLYNVPRLVDLLASPAGAPLIPLLSFNPNIITLLSYSQFMIEKLIADPALVTEFVAYSTGKNPTYPVGSASGPNNYLFSMNSLYADTGVTGGSLWKYVNTAYLGYGTLGSTEFEIQPLFYSFNIINNIATLPYNESLFYRAVYQNVAVSSAVPPTYDLTTDYLINLLGYINKNYSAASFITAISYNPHIMTFLANTPNLVYQMKRNTDILELFIFNPTVGLCVSDLYKFYYNTIPSGLLLSGALLPETGTLYTLFNKSQKMRYLLLQIYNYAIYYSSLMGSLAVDKSLLLIQFILYCIEGAGGAYTLFVDQMCSNPNIILFLVNNIYMVQKMLENPAGLIPIFTTNPQILDMGYNLLDAVIATPLEAYLDPNVQSILTTPGSENNQGVNTVLELIDVQYNNNIVIPANRGSLAPANPQRDYYMVQLYYDAMIKWPQITQLIVYALSEYATYVNDLTFNMIDYPQMINEVINENPNVMGFLQHNPALVAYLLTPIDVVPGITQTPLYRFLKIPTIKQPQKDITNYILSTPSYADFVPYLSQVIYVPSELAYLNSQTVINSNPDFYELVNQNYNSGIYAVNLFNYSNQVITLYIANTGSLLFDLTYTNPNVINFFVYYQQLTRYLNNNPSKIPVFINIPGITDVMKNIYETILAFGSSSLLSNYFTTFLEDNSNPISYHLNELLYAYPELYILFNAGNRYNNIVYDSMINTILFQNEYVEFAYRYPYIMEQSLKYPALIQYLSANSYGDDSLIRIMEATVWRQIYDIEKLTGNLLYVRNMNTLMNENYNTNLYEKVFYYNTIYGSISRFITDTGIFGPLLTNMNILLFLYNNPRLLEFYYGPSGQTNVLATNQRFRLLFNQCTSPTTDITTVFQTDPILSLYLNTSLTPGGLGSGVPPNPNNPNLLPLINGNPQLNALISQNYIFNLYYLELNNSPILTNLLYLNPALLARCYENPLIINFLYENPALVIFLYNSKVCNRDYVDLITTNPTAGQIYTDLFAKYEKSSLQPYLDATKFVPNLAMKTFLDLPEHETIKAIVYQQYNANIYYNSMAKSCQWGAGMLSLITKYPNIIDYINLNPNIINFLGQNPKMVDFFKYYYGDNISNMIFFYQLTSTVNPNSITSYGVIDSTTIQSAANPIIDLYKFYYQKLPQYLNSNPNNLGFTNGFGSTAAVNLLLSRNAPLLALCNQNYNYNVYKLFLLFNPTLTNTLLKYPEILFYFVYKNPNMINFLYFNTALDQYFLDTPAAVAFFVTLTFCQNPVLNLFDAIYQYDVNHPANPIKLSTYLEKTMYLDLLGYIGPDSLLVG